MIKKIISLTLAGAISLAVFSSNAVDTAIIADASGIILTDKTMTVAPDNITNVRIADSSGNIIDGVKATLKNSSGTAVAEFTEYAQTPTSSYFTALNGSGITSDNYSVNIWNELSQVMSPSTIYSVRKNSSEYTVNDIITAGDAYSEIYTVGHFDHTKAMDYGVPMAAYAIYIDDDWASKTGRGFYNTTEDTANNKFFDTAYGMVQPLLGRTQLALVLDPNFTFDIFRLGVSSEVDTSNDGYQLHRYPQIYDTAKEYIKYSVNLYELFPECNMYYDFGCKYSNGAFVDDENTVFDPKTDIGGTNQTSCVLTVVSGSVLSAPIPDSEGNIEFYLEKSSREYSIELNGMSVKRTVNSDFSTSYSYGWRSDYVDLVAEDVSSVTVNGVDLPDTGTNLLNLTDASYTIELSNIPEQYEAVEEYTFDVSQSQEVQYLTITLEESVKAMLGDLNNDGKITVSDAANTLSAYAQRQTTGDYGLTDESFTAADVNKDGAVTAIDASLILGYYAYTATEGKLPFEEYLNTMH